MTAVGLLLFLSAVEARAQVFQLVKKADSLYVLTLTADSTVDSWTLPHPVYRFDMGDIDGDGSTDAVVGVVKSTRFFPQPARRVFIFKQKRGHIRPLWMGSRLGGILCDFRVVDGRIRSLETTTDDRYVVAEYVWSGFGMAFYRFLARGVGKAEALKTFQQ